MTRKDFELIAAALKDAMPIAMGDPAVYRIAMESLSRVVYRMADALATTNPRFDRERFLKACGVAQ